jgi:hypothetical protein
MIVVDNDRMSVLFYHDHGKFAGWVAGMFAGWVAGMFAGGGREVLAAGR